tara:strand:- start:118 stop:312 length:195 start_codon:yes stop_codon:yes gene_type:complete
MSDKDNWVFKSGQSIIIKCWTCENDFDIRAIHREDGFCPKCENVEIDLSEEPYQPILSQLEKAK